MQAAIAKAERHPLAFFALLSAVFYSPLAFGYCFLPLSYLSVTPLWYDPSVVPANYDLFDAVIYFLPFDEFLKQQLQQGHLPLWSPYNLGGHPVAFNGQVGFFYLPKVMLLLLFPTWLAHGVSLFLHTWLAGYSSFLLARRFGLSEKTGLFGAVAWQFNGYLSVWLELSHVGICAAWTPLLVLAALRALDSWRYVPAFAAALAMLLVSAHLQIMLNFLTFGLITGLYLARPWGRIRILRFLSGMALGFGLAAPYLLPSAILMSQSQRPVLTANFLLDSYRQFLFSAAPTMIFPDLFGNPASFFCFTRVLGSGNFIYAETCLYLGVIPLFFAILSGWSRVGRVFLACGLITLLLPATPLYPFLAMLPGLNHVTSVRFVGLAQLFLVLASAFGFDAWTKSELSQPARKAYLAVLALATLAGLKLWAILSAGWQAALSDSLRLPDPALFIDRDSFHLAVKTGFQHCYRLSNPNFLLPLLSLGLLGYVLKSELPKAKSAAWLFLATLVELTAFSYRHNPVESSSHWYPETPVTSFLSQNAGSERVAGLATIKPNTLLPFAVRDAGGYDSFYPRDSAIFLESMINRPPSEDGLTAQVLTGNSLSEPLLDLLAVRYLVGRPGGVVPPGLPVVQDQGLPIYRRDSALPRAYLCSEVKLVKESSQRLKILSEPAFPRAQVALVEVESRDFEDVESGPQGTVSLVADSPNLVTLHCDTSTKQILVLADAWSPGWQVSVNGESRPLYKVNQMFRGVVVGPGESEVRFTFHPPAWTLSLCMMAISLLVCLMLGLGGRK